MSTCGLKMALCLPLRRMAICVHRRPRILSVASTTNQSPRTVSDFAKTVDITTTPTIGRAHIAAADIAADISCNFGADGPLEKGRRVYSSHLAFAKLLMPSWLSPL